MEGPEKIWVVERDGGGGYRVRQTTRTNEAAKNWAAIAVVVVGFIAVVLILL